MKHSIISLCLLLTFIAQNTFAEEYKFRVLAKQVKINGHVTSPSHGFISVDETSNIDIDNNGCVCIIDGRRYNIRGSQNGSLRNLLKKEKGENAPTLIGIIEYLASAFKGSKQPETVRTESGSVDRGESVPTDSYEYMVHSAVIDQWHHRKERDQENLSHEWVPNEHDSSIEYLRIKNNTDKPLNVNILCQYHDEGDELFYFINFDEASFIPLKEHTTFDLKNLVRVKDEKVDVVVFGTTRPYDVDVLQSILRQISLEKSSDVFF